MTLRIAIEFGADRIGRLARIDQSRIRDDPPQPVVDLLVACDRPAQGFGGILAFGQISQLALIIGGKGFGLLRCQCEIGLKSLAVETGIEIVQIPFRQKSQIGIGLSRARIGMSGETGWQIDGK